MTVIGKGIPFACDPRNPERSAIEAGTIRIGKDLAGAIALLLLGVLALGKKGVRHLDPLTISTTIAQAFLIASVEHSASGPEGDHNYDDDK